MDDILAGIDEFLADDPAEEASDRVSAAELAEWLGLTSSRINQLARDGVIPRETAPGGYVFPCRAGVRAYCEHTRAAASRKSADPKLAAEKLRLTTAQADKAEQQAARDRGELVHVDEVRKAWGQIITELRGALLAAPERVASTVGLDRAATTALDAEIRAALTQLADHGGQDGPNPPLEAGQEGQ